MRYFANPSTAKVRDAMRAGLLGFIATPKQGNALIAGVPWCADNGCYGKGYPGDEAWFAWLERHASNAGSCIFATAPDVVGDAAATLERSAPWLGRIRALGYPAALVAQDGLEDLTVPWDDFDVLFIGGTTEWKLGAAARALIAEAKARGKHVHMGRVNTRSRIRLAFLSGVDSVDGTCISRGPDVNLPRITRYMREAHLADLFGEASA